MIGGARRGRVGDCRFHHFPPNRAPQAHLPHQSGNGTARHINAFALQLTPDLANPVDLDVLFPDPRNIRPQNGIPLRSCRCPAGVHRQATWARYVDGAIGSTLQIGSTPWTAR
jgi:hypothetical protein